MLKSSQLLGFMQPSSELLGMQDGLQQWQVLELVECASCQVDMLYVQCIQVLAVLQRFYKHWPRKQSAHQ